MTPQLATTRLPHDRTTRVAHGLVDGELPRGEPPRSSGKTGFTLVELLIVVGIAGVLLVVVAANLTYQRVKYQTIGTISDLQDIHAKGRFEALNRHRQTWLVIDEDGKTVTLWCDSAVAPNGVLEVGVDQVLESFRIPDWVGFERAGSGRAVDYFGTNYDTIEYRSDGSIVAPATASEPALYLTDRKGNALRLRVNAVTGSTRVEMSVDGNWTGRTERWTWKY